MANVRQHKTKRMRQQIKRFLKENPRSTTKAIQVHLNSTTRHGCTPNQVTNILAKDPEIKEVGNTRIAGLIGTYKVNIWELISDDD